MTPVTLTSSEIISFAVLWVLTALIAYLSGSLKQRDRLIAQLEQHLAWLKATFDDPEDAR